MFIYLCSQQSQYIYIDRSGYWIHVVVSAAVGAVVGAFVEATTQVVKGKGSFVERVKGIKGYKVAASAISGALDGALMSVGVSPVLAGAITGGVGNTLEQYWENNNNIRKVNPVEVAVNSGLGALFGSLSDKVGKLFKTKDVSGYLSSRGKALSKRIFNAFKHKIGKNAGKEIGKAFVHYFKTTMTLTIRHLIKEQFRDGIRDGFTEEFLKSSGFDDAFINFLNGQINCSA